MFFKSETYFEVVEEQHRKHKDTDIILPTRAHHDDAGYDLYCPVDIEIPGLNFADDVIFKSELIWLDVKVHLPKENFLMIAIRSGVGTNSELTISNAVPIIDARHYYNKKNGGNIGVKIRNFSKKPYFIKKGDRIAQGVVLPYGVVKGDYYYDSNEVDSGGLGGTGK